MALLIEQKLNERGIEIPQVYVRFKYTVDYDGKKAYVNTKCFTSKEYFLEDIYGINNSIKINSIPESFIMQIKPGDVLQQIHEKFTELLSTDITKKEVIKDKTGEPKKDKDGNNIYEDIIISNKLAKKNKIKTIDI